MAPNNILSVAGPPSPVRESGLTFLSFFCTRRFPKSCERYDEADSVKRKRLLKGLPQNGCTKPHMHHTCTKNRPSKEAGIAPFEAGFLVDGYSFAWTAILLHRLLHRGSQPASGAPVPVRHDSGIHGAFRYRSIRIPVYSVYTYSMNI